MEYHVTHHMFPTVPSYNLDKLHHHIKDQLPRTNDGLIDAYKEILPALMKQKEDSSYYFKKSIAYEIIQHALGIKTKVMQDCIPENAQAKVIFNSRIFVAIWIAVILWSLITLSWLPVLFFLLPKFYGRTLHKLVSFTQHAGLARDIKDHRYTTREMYLNPILSFLYWKMEYHVTHHMFPTVPSYNLDKLHHHIKDQLPKTNDGLIDAYKEILPAIMKQTEDSSYFFKKEVPEPQNV